MNPPQDTFQTMLELFKQSTAKTNEYLLLKQNDPTDPRLKELEKEHNHIFEQAKQIVEAGK